MRRVSGVEKLLVEFASIKADYDTEPTSHRLAELGKLGVSSLRLLNTVATLVSQGKANFGKEEKIYVAYETQKKSGLKVRRSRPVFRDLLITDPKEFAELWAGLIAGIDTKSRRIKFSEIDTVVYTATQSFSCAIDVLKPGSRKIPGTHFEVLMGTLLGAATGLARGKQVPIAGERYKVPTDILLLRDKTDPGPMLVVATKTTSRERIVQPFAHQRILEEIEPGRYRSIIVMVSELQRSDISKNGVNEICVPNQIGMFQKYLAHLEGLYYLDLPYTYVTAGFTTSLPVQTVGELLSADLPSLLAAKKT